MPFHFKHPDQWQRFDQYRLGSGLSTEPDERQISTLLLCMGEDSFLMVGFVNPVKKKRFRGNTSTHISDEDRRSYRQRVVTKFDEFFFKVRILSLNAHDLIDAVSPTVSRWNSS